MVCSVRFGVADMAVRPEHLVALPAPETQDRPVAAAGRAGPPESGERGETVEDGDGTGSPETGKGTGAVPDPNPDGG